MTKNQPKIRELLIEEIKKYVKGVKEHPLFGDDYHASMMRVETHYNDGCRGDLELIDRKIKMYRAIHWHFMENDLIKYKFNREKAWWELKEELKDFEGLADKIYEESKGYINSDVNEYTRELYNKCISK